MMRIIAFPVPSAANAHRGIGSRTHGTFRLCPFGSWGSHGRLAETRIRPSSASFLTLWQPANPRTWAFTAFRAQAESRAPQPGAKPLVSVIAFCHKFEKLARNVEKPALQNKRWTRNAVISIEAPQTRSRRGAGPAKGPPAQRGGPSTRLARSGNRRGFLHVAWGVRSGRPAAA